MPWSHGSGDWDSDYDDEPWPLYDSEPEGPVQEPEMEQEPEQRQNPDHGQTAGHASDTSQDTGHAPTGGSSQYPPLQALFSRMSLRGTNASGQGSARASGHAPGPIPGPVPAHGTACGPGPAPASGTAPGQQVGWRYYAVWEVGQLQPGVHCGPHPGTWNMILSHAPGKKYGQACAVQRFGSEQEATAAYIPRAAGRGLPCPPSVFYY